ncbi:MAG: peptide chain release factor 2 [Chlamydiae bacterium]|nr:peptide chain release factor 2 [Chlamydiota bacterium]
MNDDIQELIKNLEERLLHMSRYLDLAVKERQVEELDRKMQELGFWDDNAQAQKTIATCNALKAWTAPYRAVAQRVENVRALLPEVIELGDVEIEMDGKNCFLSINAGAGGTEACDWALMLSRMYLRWAHRKGFHVEVLDTIDGDVAGFKSATYKLSGPYAFGYAKAEKGVHRLVRISPFDSNAKRHTSFASVDVTPEIDDDISIEIRPEHLRVDTYRASGAGGQHVNKTDSAVRITHLATGIVVSCQNERSQFQNKETCMKILRAKLYDKARLDRASKIEALGGEKKEIAWGSQIRNYVFQPYTLVKDTRTRYEVGNIDAVMDGDIDGFINAYLKEFG